MPPLIPIKNIKILTQQPPGTLKYTGRQKPAPSIMELIEYSGDKVERRKIKSLNEMPESRDSVIWLNVVGMHDAPLIQELGEKFGIHRIDMEGVVNVLERSKVEEREGYLFTLLKMVYIENDKVVHEHISIILKGNVLLTFQEHEADVFDAVRERIEKGLGQVRKLGADYLFNSLTDNVIDRYYAIINYIEDRFTQTETAIIMDNRNEMNQVYWLRKELLYLKNSLEPIQSSLKSILGEDTLHISEGTLPYLKDVHENVVQIMEEIQSFREMVNGLYETQMSNAGNNMNRIMMTLTIFSAIFIPLSFLAGVFGMNFVSVPGLSWPGAFVAFCIGCVAIATVMLIFFKRSKWF